MKIVKIFVIVTLFLIFACHENYKNKNYNHKKQNKEETSFLYYQLKEADSVLIVSHDNTHKIVRDNPNNAIDSISLVENGILNKNIIHEAIKITDFKDLVYLLDKKNEDSITNPMPFN
jgi:hypothetical protein